jgi:hypothetical protein
MEDPGDEGHSLFGKRSGQDGTLNLGANKLRGNVGAAKRQ